MRKRELTVEAWLREMEENIEMRDEIGPLAFYRRHMAMGHDMPDVIYELQMAEMWRDSGKQVYEFDSDFTDSILNERWVSLLPDCIDQRPHDCFYMKLPCAKDNEGTVVSIVDAEEILGFDESLFPGLSEGKGVYIGGDEDYGRRVVVNTGSRYVAVMSFSISKTMELMLDDTEVEVYPAELVANGVAYLCSANADIVPVYAPQPGIRRNNAKRRSQAVWSEVGYRIGSELRAYKRAESERKPHQGGTVRPHMRRAHWHHYWTGPRDGERRLVLKWIAPTMVNVKSGVGSATLHRVS